MRVFCERGAEIVAHARVREFLEDDQGSYKAFIIERYIGSQEEGDRILGDVVLSARPLDRGGHAPGSGR
jgi:hypothetical protein